MTHWKLLPVTVLVLALAACGAEEDAAPEEAASTKGDAGAEATGRGGPFDSTPDDPEEVWDDPDSTSQKLWSLIQEQHSELTGEQQRALQACAELKLQERDIESEQAVGECRTEMEEEAEEQEEEDEGDGES